MPVSRFIKKMVEDATPSSMKIGKTVKHPDGRTVKIISGQHWGAYGWSNFWEWREVLPDGKLGPKECGYGW